MSTSHPLDHPANNAELIERNILRITADTKAFLDEFVDAQEGFVGDEFRRVNGLYDAYKAALETQTQTLALKLEYAKLYNEMKQVIAELQKTKQQREQDTTAITNLSSDFKALQIPTAEEVAGAVYSKFIPDKKEFGDVIAEIVRHELVAQPYIQKITEAFGASKGFQTLHDAVIKLEKKVPDDIMQEISDLQIFATISGEIDKIVPVIDSGFDDIADMIPQDLVRDMGDVLKYCSTIQKRVYNIPGRTTMTSNLAKSDKTAADAAAKLVTLVKEQVNQAASLKGLSASLTSVQKSTTAVEKSTTTVDGMWSVLKGIDLFKDLQGLVKILSPKVMIDAAKALVDLREMEKNKPRATADTIEKIIATLKEQTNTLGTINDKVGQAPTASTVATAVSNLQVIDKIMKQLEELKTDTEALGGLGVIQSALSLAESDIRQLDLRVSGIDLPGTATTITSKLDAIKKVINDRIELIPTAETIQQKIIGGFEDKFKSGFEFAPPGTSDLNTRFTEQMAQMQLAANNLLRPLPENMSLERVTNFWNPESQVLITIWGDAHAVNTLKATIGRGLQRQTPAYDDLMDDLEAVSNSLQDLFKAHDMAPWEVTHLQHVLASPSFASVVAEYCNDAWPDETDQADIRHRNRFRSQVASTTKLNVFAVRFLLHLAAEDINAQIAGSEAPKVSPGLGLCLPSKFYGGYRIFTLNSLVRGLEAPTHIVWMCNPDATSTDEAGMWNHWQFEHWSGMSTQSLGGLSRPLSIASSKKANLLRATRQKLDNGYAKLSMQRDISSLSGEELQNMLTEYAGLASRPNSKTTELGSMSGANDPRQRQLPLINTTLQQQASNVTTGEQPMQFAPASGGNMGPPPVPALSPHLHSGGRTQHADGGEKRKRESVIDRIRNNPLIKKPSQASVGQSSQKQGLMAKFGLGKHKHVEGASTDGEPSLDQTAIYPAPIGDSGPTIDPTSPPPAISPAPEVSPALEVSPGPEVSPGAELQPHPDSLAVHGRGKRIYVGPVGTELPQDTLRALSAPVRDFLQAQPERQRQVEDYNERNPGYCVESQMASVTRGQSRLDKHWHDRDGPCNECKSRGGRLCALLVQDNTLIIKGEVPALSIEEDNEEMEEDFDPEHAPTAAFNQIDDHYGRGFLISIGDPPHLLNGTRFTSDMQTALLKTNKVNKKDDALYFRRANARKNKEKLTQCIATEVKKAAPKDLGWDDTDGPCNECREYHRQCIVMLDTNVAYDKGTMD